MLFSIIVKVIVTLYALLMVFASIREFNSKDRLGNTVNIISGIAIFLSNFLKNEYFKIILIIGLLVFIVAACIWHLFGPLRPGKVHIELIHKKLWQVIVLGDRSFGYWTGLVHKRFRF